MNELARIENTPNGIQKMQTQDQAMVLIQAVANGTLSSENAKAAMELAERFNAFNAKREFAAAFSAMQGELPKVVARHKADRYKYASMDDILSSVQPVLSAFGFSVRWGTEWDDKRITAVCHLQHSSGHEEVSKFAVRISAAPGISPAQGDGSTLTYARRYALCGVLNINIDKDNDGAGPRAEGAFITAEQAADLERRAKETGRDIVKLLHYAEADSFGKIRQSKYAVLDNLLRKAERERNKVEVSQMDSSGVSPEDKRTSTPLTTPSTVGDGAKSASPAGG